MTSNNSVQLPWRILQMNSFIGRMEIDLGAKDLDYGHRTAFHLNSEVDGHKTSYVHATSLLAFQVLVECLLYASSSDFQWKVAK